MRHPLSEVCPAASTTMRMAWMTTGALSIMMLCPDPRSGQPSVGFGRPGPDETHMVRGCAYTVAELSPLKLGLRTPTRGKFHWTQKFQQARTYFAQISHKSPTNKTYTNNKQIPNNNH
jgi:hypothetical protein